MVEIAVIPPFPYLRDVSKIIENDKHIKLGAQTAFFEPKGAFTGAVAASMLSSVGVDYVLIGVRRINSFLYLCVYISPPLLAN